MDTSTTLGAAPRHVLGSAVPLAPCAREARKAAGTLGRIVFERPPPEEAVAPKREAEAPPLAQEVDAS